jgi:hypothetical protein
MTSVSVNRVLGNSWHRYWPTSPLGETVPTPFDAEFDVSVLTTPQFGWCVDRAHNHHFDSVLLDKINDEGAWLTIVYDDGIHIHFFVNQGGKAEVLGSTYHPSN